MLYPGCGALVIVAAIFSGTRQEGAHAKKRRHNISRPSPVFRTPRTITSQDLKNQVAAAEQNAAQQPANPADPSLANATPAQQAAAQAYGPTGQPVPCVPGQPCAPQGQQQHLSGAQEEQQLAAKDRELAYDSRFASNLVFDAGRARSTAAAKHQNRPADTASRNRTPGQETAAYCAAHGRRSAGISSPRRPSTAKAGGQYRLRPRASPM